MNGTQFRVLIGDLGTMSDHGANARRGSLQTLLMRMGCEGVLGLLPDLIVKTQGRLAQARLTLGYVTQPLWGWCEAEHHVENRCASNLMALLRSSFEAGAAFSEIGFRRDRPFQSLVFALRSALAFGSICCCFRSLVTGVGGPAGEKSLAPLSDFSWHACATQTAESGSCYCFQSYSSTGGRGGIFGSIGK